MSIAAFSGLTETTFEFLREIGEHNDKLWFDAHRKDYEAGFVSPARQLVDELGPRLRALSPTVRFEPRINGSIARINRDIRFSKDKRPYKDHLDLWFWHGERRGWEAPGFFFRMTADRLFLGVGMHQFPPATLEAFLRALIGERSGPALVVAIDKVRATGPYLIGGATRKTVPRGFDASHPRAGLLLHEGLWAELRTEPGEVARSSGFIDFCAAHFAAMWPVGRWLLDELPATA
jgi:uncharacterized protein (TIGR02453 family)